MFLFYFFALVLASSDGSTSFMQLCEKDIGKAEELLINEGRNLDINAKDRGKRSAIFYALKGTDGDPDCRLDWILFLLNAKDSPRIEHKLGFKPVFQFDPEQRDDQFNTLLMLAAEKYPAEVIHQLLKYFKDNDQKQSYIDRPNLLGNTALHVAVIYENISAVEALLNEGASTEAFNLNSLTPLQVAVKRSSLPSIKLLLDFNADVDRQTSFDLDTLLMEAVRRFASLDMIRLLVTRSKNLNAISNLDGRNVLELAEEQLKYSISANWRPEDQLYFKEVLTILKNKLAEK